VLITGGAGFIGSRLSAALLADACRVVVVDVLHPQVYPDRTWPAALPTAAERHLVDVTDAGAMEEVVASVRPDVVVHLAAETGTGQSLTEATRHGHVNVVGTTTLMDALTRADHRPQHVLLASSRAVYGEGLWRVRDGEQFYAAARDPEHLARGHWDPVGPPGPSAAVLPEPQRAGVVEPRPSNVYAATKLAQEHLLGAWTSAMGVRLSVLRLQNVYGPGQSLANPYTGVLNVFAQQALAGRPVDVYEDGLIVRDFVHVDDVVAAFRLALRRESGGLLLQDVGSGRPATLLEVARLTAELAGGPEPVVSGRYRIGDVRAAWADVAPAREHLGYVPGIDLRTGVAALLDSVRDREAVSGEAARV
jgi:dTDP-L-rhamnose 4-epimerase